MVDTILNLNSMHLYMASSSLIDSTAALNCAKLEFLCN